MVVSVAIGDSTRATNRVQVVVDAHHDVSAPDLTGVATTTFLTPAAKYGSSVSVVTMKNIRQNLFLAFVYSAVGVPVAAGVLYPLTGTLISPIWASAAMTLSSLSVIANALRLRHARLW